MTTGTSPLRTEIVHSEERFRALADAWRDLHEQSGSRSIFLSWEWLHGWWRHFGSGRALWMGAAFEGERLVGMAPLCIETDPGPARLRSLWNTTPSAITFSGALGSRGRFFK